MSTKKGINVKLGDVFLIPLSQGSDVGAQVIVKSDILYVAIFDRVYSSDPNPDEVVADKCSLSGWTMDGKIYHGDWKIIGAAGMSNTARYLKNYLVTYQGASWVTDVDGNMLRPASEKDRAALFLRSSYSPARLERAVRAFHGLEEWSQDFDGLRNLTGTTWAN